MIINEFLMNAQQSYRAQIRQLALYQIHERCCLQAHSVLVADKLLIVSVVNTPM